MTTKSFSHAECNFRRDSIRHSCAQWSSTCRPGKCGTSSAVGRVQARHSTSEAAPSGSIVLDWAEDDLEELEIRSGHRSTGNGDLMAAQTIQNLLVAIISGKRTRTSTNEYCDSQAGPDHG